MFVGSAWSPTQQMSLPVAINQANTTDYLRSRRGPSMEQRRLRATPPGRRAPSRSRSPCSAREPRTLEASGFQGRSGWGGRLPFPSRPGFRRSRAFAALPALDEVVLGLLRLARNKVRPRTQELYTSSLLLLRAWLCRRVLPQLELEQWDDLLPDMFEWMYDREYQLAVAVRLAAAPLWAFPVLGGPLRKALPASSRALEGWRRQEPAKSRPPIPQGVAWGMADALLSLGHAVAGLLVMVLFETYMRPSEALALRGLQVIPPLPNGRGTLGQWSFMIHAGELMTPGKTNEFDHIVSLDLPRQQWLGRVLGKFMKTRSLSEPAWGLTYEHFLRYFRLGLEACQAQVLRPSPYGLRHGGASHDRAVRARGLLSVQQRGGWKSFQASGCTTSAAGWPQRCDSHLCRALPSAQPATQKALLALAVFQLFRSQPWPLVPRISWLEDSSAGPV